jgi:hypothetical protein
MYKEELRQHIVDKIHRDEQIITKLERDEEGSIKHPGDVVFMNHLNKWINIYKDDLDKLKK